MSTLDASAALAAARTSGDADRIADALVAYAAATLDAGQLPESLAALDEARAIHDAAGRTQDVARALHLSATVCRVLANLDDALDRARRAEQLADAATPQKVAAIMEQGEVAVLRGEYRTAADHYQRALVEGKAAGLLPEHAARLMRKRGKMLAAAGRFADAAMAIGDAFELHQQSGTHGEARRALVELAVVHEQAGKFERAEKMIALARDEAAAADDHHVAADVELLAAGRAVAAQDFARALEHARLARQHALDAPAPLSYVSAVMSIAEIADATGDHDTAYEALASGWVTSGDVMGTEAARQIFEPRLEQLREAWGYPEFLRARDAYNDRRRAAILTGK